MDLKQFAQSIQQIADEKGIAKEKILETIELALAAAYKRDYGKRGQIIRAKLDPATGKMAMKQIKVVVDESMIKSEEEVLREEAERAARVAQESEKMPEETRTRRTRELEESAEEFSETAEGERKVRFNPEKHIMLDEAQKINSDIQPGEELAFDLPEQEAFGRIAAQTAKQVIIQRIREAEREAVFEEYKGKEGEIMSGLVQRIEGRNVFVDIGRTVGLLAAEEQISYERYRTGQRIKVMILLVEKNPKGPGIFLSRSHPKLLRKLFEIEVPEIAAGSVIIEAVAREPGSRSKVAVSSREQSIDPVGSLVGQKGVRVSTVINELGGEKIDVIEWSDDQGTFIGNSLSPAKVLAVELDERRKEARVTVPEEQLSLAIGKGGQNVRLAAKLTGWKIDVRSNKAPAEPAASVETVPTEVVSEASEKVSESVSEENK